jgi:hypothetical protein
MGLFLQNEGFRVGAEIGVQAGKFADSVLQQWTSAQIYYCIDLWSQQRNYQDSANVDNSAQELLFLQTQNTLSKFSHRTNVKYLRKSSIEAAKDIPDKSLDWVYLDARHDYPGVMADLRAYWPKLRDSGILSGHDFMNAHEVLQLSGQRWNIGFDGKDYGDKAVRTAVEDFASEIQRQIVTTIKEVHWSTWFIRK